MGFLSVLSMIWSFTWLHIMTIDIWFSFRAPRTMTGPLQKNEMKRLIQYSLCGWGLPIFWILFILFLSRVNGVSYAIRPIVGEDKCYMEDTDSREGNYAYVLFVITPLLIQQIINLVLFIRTIMYCLRIKAEIEKMRDDVRAQKDLNASKKRLILISKLAVIMGVSFLFETISSIIDFSATKVTTTIEVIWDSINCLQGVFIFIIFICKKKVYDNICEEIPFLKPRKFSSVSSTATQQISLQQFEGN
ncbi:hypothetical protein WA026_003159 [Henosepilachna vigintioctopunctata]|uniref:G-protein coupled receptors family 2 profile 2 domain-containing protein n=1 Tax=Henosepilachna vigintioctopunctata TaxID=420089 RepID=A0AAW1TI12_9CUCU